MNCTPHALLHADTGFSERWIEGHQLAAAALGKPLVLEEFGKIATGTAANMTRLRDPVYRWEAMEQQSAPCLRTVALAAQTCQPPQQLLCHLRGDLLLKENISIWSSLVHVPLQDCVQCCGRQPGCQPSAAWRNVLGVEPRRRVPRGARHPDWRHRLGVSTAVCCFDVLSIANLNAKSGAWMVHPASNTASQCATTTHQLVLGSCAACWSVQMVGSSSPGVEHLLPAARRSASLQLQANQLPWPLSL